MTRLAHLLNVLLLVAALGLSVTAFDVIARNGVASDRAELA